MLDPGRGSTKAGYLWTYVRDEHPWAVGGTATNETSFMLSALTRVGHYPERVMEPPGSSGSSSPLTPDNAHVSDGRKIGKYIKFWFPRARTRG